MTCWNLPKAKACQFVKIKLKNPQRIPKSNEHDEPITHKWKLANDAAKKKGIASSKYQYILWLLGWILD